ncbi:MAG: FliM/FliN family flagellar motor switch protein [Puniceicoccales bacterium]|jgi:type III secretion system YscQ/HrcQ family protein|nr:FliM/FliN family flagellar motor switch protein [Puniceicoccales bacterium]
MNPKSKNITPKEEAVETGGDKNSESLTPESSKLSEPATTNGKAASEKKSEPDSPEEDEVTENSDVKEEAEAAAESAVDDSTPEGSGGDNAGEEEIAEEFPEDTEITDPAAAAEVEAAAEKITAGWRPLVEKAGQLRKEAQFVASQRMATGNINVGEIEVQLTFDVGDVTLTLKELEGMKEGYTLTTNRPVDEVVNIRANGHLIGRGRLVKVEGRLGVQIEELRGSSVDAVPQ